MDNRNRTVSYGMEYFRDSETHTPHDYQVYYINGLSSIYSKIFDSYQKAFDYAKDAAQYVLNTDELEIDDKIKVLGSLQIMDVTESRDVTTAELKNLILSYKNQLL